MLAAMTRSWPLLFVFLVGCEKHDVAIETPASGRALTATEKQAMQTIADETFREVRGELEGLPPRLTLVVRWGKDVIPETGENGAAAYPSNVGWTVDPDRDVLAIIRAELRPTLAHELHHLARASRITSRSLRDRVVTEGLATAYERKYRRSEPPWGAAPPEIATWTEEIARQPAAADPEAWMIRHPDGRRWVGMRVGTHLVDRATRASGKTPATLVFASSADIFRLAGVD